MYRRCVWFRDDHVQDRGRVVEVELAVRCEATTRRVLEKRNIRQQNRKLVGNRPAETTVPLLRGLNLAGVWQKVYERVYLQRAQSESVLAQRLQSVQAEL